MLTKEQILASIKELGIDVDSQNRVKKADIKKALADVVLAGKELTKFINYCMTVYGPKGEFPIKGITPQLISDAVGELAMSDHNFGGGDSVDREKVRDYILDVLKQTTVASATGTPTAS